MLSALVPAPGALADVGTPPVARRSVPSASGPITSPGVHMARLPRPSAPPLPAVPREKVIFRRVPRAAGGVKIEGPTIVQPHLTNPRSLHNSRAAVQSFLQRQPTTLATPPPARPLERSLSPLGTRSGAPGGSRAASATRRLSSVDVSQPNATGINRWWTYEEGTIPGVGRYMINLWQQNLLMQSDDMDVHYRGIDLAFRRTYNSYSGHTFEDADGSSEIGQYGNGWTNTFDAHVSYNNAPAGGWSVFDVDGARYDYSYDGNGNLVPPPGMEGTSLVTNGGAFYWTKKNGTQYTFYAPYYPAQYAAYNGRIYRISARNSNNYIQFGYAWDGGDSSTSAHLNTIYATTDSGKQAVLEFADFSGRRLCSSLIFPDGQTTVSYSYDGSGNLSIVSKPGNDASSARNEQYGGFGQTWLWVTSPRYNQSGAAEGGYLAFYAPSPGAPQIGGVAAVGTVNFTPNDGTNSVLQPAAGTGVSEYSWTPVTAYSGYTTVTDTDGHQEIQYLDGQGRPTQRYRSTGAQWLSTSEGWDAHNHLVATTDERGNETDYAYDANDNTVAVAKPPTHLADGYFRPTAWYVYDGFDNVVAFCDPHATHQLGGDWISGFTAGSNPCSTGTTLAHRFAYTYPGQEPFGELATATEPSTPAASGGYQRSYAYDPSSQGGNDYGLPTSVTGGAIANDDGTNVTPQQTFQYDSSGNLTGYNGGSGTWSLAYDSLGRLTSATDPDNVTSYKSYFPDGSLKQTQTASQHAAGGGATFGYDADDDVTTETHAYANVTGVTHKYYDGADRLVEVQQPQDANADYYGFPWLTRYIYDLSQGGGVAYNGQGSIPGYGNLVVTQSYVATQAIPVANGPDPLGASYAQWRDVRATAFDALDRKTASYEAAFGTQAKESLQYDGTGSDGVSVNGELRELDRPTGESVRYRYDEVGRLTNRDYSGGPQTTPGFSAAYDENGNLLTRGTSAFPGEALAYDAMNRLVSDVEPQNSAHNTVSHTYYPNGWPRAVGLMTATTNTPAVYSWSYRADGKRQTLGLENTQTFAWTYSAAGRVLSQSDPFTGSTIDYSALNTPDGPANMQPESMAYDAYGRLTSQTMPGGVLYSGFSYDGEDQVQAFTGATSPPSSAPAQAEFCAHLSARNEAYADQSVVLPSMEGGAAPSPAFCTPSPNVTWAGGLPKNWASGITVSRPLSGPG
ncbi:MAG: hypothetical protein JOZ24_08380, partial [Candidatus Eremiobacteraeota bacterium]|nr:hypothetical protein [Candidatus Eremiobacteraeota bacterium]